MTTIKTTFKRIICILSCCLVVVFSFTFTSSAVDYTFSVNVPNPIEIGYDGYFTIPYTNGTNTYLQVVFWRALRTNTSYSDDIVAEDLLVSINLTSKSTFDVTLEHVGGDVVFGVIASTNTQNNYYTPPSTSLMTDSIPYTSSFGCPSGYTYLYPQQSSGTYEVTSSSLNGRPILSQIPLKSYSVVWGYDDTYNQLNDVLEHFSEMLSKMDLTNEQLSVLVDYMSQILEVTGYISADLSDFIYVYWSQFQQEEFPNALGQVITNLQKIVQALDPKDAEELTTYAPDTFDDLNKADESLHDMIDSDEYESLLDGGLDGYVDLDTPAYRLIWDFITGAFNSHPEILLLVLTVLSLGIIALILNR